MPKLTIKTIGIKPPKKTIKRVIVPVVKIPQRYLTIQEVRDIANSVKGFETAKAKRAAKFIHDNNARREYPQAFKGNPTVRQAYIEKYNHPLAKTLTIRGRQQLKKDRDTIKRMFVNYQIKHFDYIKKHSSLKITQEEHATILRQMFKFTRQEIDEILLEPTLNMRSDNFFTLSVKTAKCLDSYKSDNFYASITVAAYNLVLTAKTYSKQTLSNAYIEAKNGLIALNQDQKKNIRLVGVEYRIDKLLGIILLDLDIPDLICRRRPDILLQALYNLSIA